MEAVAFYDPVEREETELAQDHNIAALRQRASQRLPSPIFDYIDGGAEDERALRDSVEAFDRARLMPRMMVDVSTLDTSSTLFGRKIPLPLMLAPTGLTRLFHPEAEQAVARAADFIERTLDAQGLMPPSESHEGYSGNPVHAYWDDFWALRGLVDAQAMAQGLGHGADVGRWRQAAERLERGLYGSIAEVRRRRGLDYIPASSDLGDFDPMATAAKFKFDPAGAGEPSAADDHAAQAAAAAVEEVDIMRAEEEMVGAVRLRPQAGRPVIQPDDSVFHPDGEFGCFADEAMDEGGTRPIIDVVGRADLLDSALAHHNDPVSQFQRLLLVMRDEDGRVSGPVVELAQPLAQFLSDFRIQCAEGFIQQQYARLDRHGACERHALALATGQLVRIAFFKSRKLHHLKKFADTPTDLGLRGTRCGRPDLQAKADILRHRHVAKQRVMLEDEADVTLLDALVRRILAAEQDLSFGRLIQPGNQPQKRRLA